MVDDFETETSKYTPPEPTRPLPLTPSSRAVLESACVAMFDILSNEIEYDFGLVGPSGELYVQPSTKWGQLVSYLSSDETRERLVHECADAVQQEIQVLENPEFRKSFEIPKIYKM